MRNVGGGLLILALLVAGCASETGSTPSSVAGTWFFQVLSSGCPEVTGIANGNDGLQTEVFEVFQSGNQVSASFVDNGGFNCSFDGTYVPDELRGTLTITDGFRTLELSLEGFARDFGGQVQVDGWARVNQDTDGDCEGAIIEFCAKVGGQPPANNPPQVSFSGTGSTVDLCVVEGTVVDLEYIDNDEGNATTTLLADRDGDRLTTDDQIVIAAGRPDQNGQSQTAMWDTTGVPAAEYTIIAVTTDGQFTTTATRVGTVTVICDTPVDLTFATGADSADNLEANGIASFPDGSFVTAGRLVGTAVFGEGEPNETTLVSVGGEDIFVARYNADGTLRWALREGGPTIGGDGESDWADDVSAFPDGSTVIVGRFHGSVTFGEGETNETTLTSQGADDSFVARYDAAGMLLWATQDRSGGTNEGWTVTALEDGTCVAAGRFFGSVTLGFGEPNETTLSSGGEFDIWVARFDTDGSLLWARSAGAAGRDRPLDSAGFADGSAVIVGFFEDETDFGNGTISAVDGREIFVARYDANGNLSWVQVGRGPGDDRADGVTALLDGSVVITGEWDDSLTFAEGESNETTITSAGRDDVLIARFAADGSLVFAKSDGGPDKEEGVGIASFPDGSVIIVGEVEDAAVLGVGTPNETAFIADAEGDFFYAHYDANGDLIWACREGGPDFDAAEYVAAFSDGSFVAAGRSDPGPKTFGKGDPNETEIDDTAPIVRYMGAPVGDPLEPPPPPGALTDAQVLALCNTVDIVFIVDTSLSMVDDAAALNTVLPQVVSQLQALAATEGASFTVNSTILGITETGSQALARINADIAFFNTLLAPVGLQIPAPPGNAFDFINDSVLARLGGTVPPATSLTFADPIDAGPLGFGFESWASGTAIVADRFNWTSGAVRIAAPIGDEGPEEGLSGEMFTVPIPPFPVINIADRGVCDQADTDATTNAISVAARNNVIVSPVTGFLQDSIAQLLGQPGSFNTCAVDEGNRLASGTGGQRFSVQDPATDMAGALVDLVIAACRSQLLRGGPRQLIAFSRDGDLYDVDPLTGQATRQLGTTFNDGGNFVDLNVVSSAIYVPALDQLWLGQGGASAEVPNACPGCILTLDIGSFGLTSFLSDNLLEQRGIAGMAIRADGSIFSPEGDDGRLFELDRNTGAPTPLGDPNAGSTGLGMTFDDDGNFYVAGRTSSLSRVDPDTAELLESIALTYVGFPFTGTPNAISSMATLNGTIYAIVRESSTTYLATIDPSTGTVTNVGQNNLRLDGLAAVPRSFMDELILE